ncbi:unnamed protein product [Paramecium pentaurelia]|uniref:Uncharacterized protein n=1 Tax=Paramecium pentaurelia TaxID=43138 RepID=A0A8S1WIB6_9CILI|nr:unnamed protein product [Paramecium pentaurelia]
MLYLFSDEFISIFQIKVQNCIVINNFVQQLFNNKSTNSQVQVIIIFMIVNRERNSKNITKQKVQKLNRISTIHIGIIEILSCNEIIINQEKILRIQSMIGVMRRFQFPEFRQNNKQNER